jgi:tRNA (guanine-N7-)-methyltransferase
VSVSDPSGAFFGRRKGKRLRAGQDDLVQTLLPRIRVAPGAMPDRETWLEIGFGGGEHLLAQARAHPDVAMVGCEPFLNGMAKLLAAVDREALTNVRVFDDDVIRLLPAWPSATIDRVSILYPDPWPKRRQRKRRLVSDAFLSELARIMRPGAELRFATDIDDYAGWTIARVLRSDGFRWDARRPHDWRQPWAGWPGTRYEAKALAAGRVPSYLTFTRV